MKILEIMAHKNKVYSHNVKIKRGLMHYSKDIIEK